MILTNHIMAKFRHDKDLDDNDFFLGEDVTQKRQIINLDCSLRPTDSCMTSRFCKKKS